MINRTVSHYEIRATLGTGAMGQVYKAWDRRHGCWRALKFLPPHLAADEEALQRLMREARAASSLEHGHICTIYDLDRDEDGNPFIVMAYYEGQDLRQRLDAGPLAPSEALRLAREIALGLGAAHRHGIVHRDIKPANVMVTADDEAVILDFGLAYLVDETRLTRQGGQSGTLAYMAPEQLHGAEPAAAADIWALGVLLHEMLSGHLPFRAEFPAAMIYVVANEAAELLPKEIEQRIPGCQAILDRCLDKDPARRYASAQDLAADLEALRHGTVQGNPPQLRAMRWLVVSAALLAAAGSAWLVFAGLQHFAARPDTRGVAVLPFEISGASEGDHMFGAGLGWVVADRIGRLDAADDRFWIVPPDDFHRFEVRDPVQVRDRFGVDRTITGVGTIYGTEVNLRVEYVGAAGAEPVAREFRDDIGNLQTWQHELVAWCAQQIGGELTPQKAAVLDRGCTRVPAAYRDYVEAIGWDRQNTRLDREARASNKARADSLWAAAVQRDSSFACARAELGWGLWSRRGADAPQREQAALAHLAAAARLDPRLAWAHCYRGQAFVALRDTAGALRELAMALRLDPVHKPSQLIRARLLVAAGPGREQEADQAVADLCAARPGYVADLLEAGSTYWYNGRHERTVEFWREAAERAPRSPRAQNYLGVVLFEVQDDPAAESCFLKALAIAPDYTTRLNLGTWYYYHNQYRDALTQYLAAMAMEEGSGGEYGLWRDIAEAYRWSPGFEDSVSVVYARARRMAERRLAETPDAVAVKAELATFCSVLGDTARTLELLEEIAAAPELGDNADFMICVAWEDIGRRDEALAWLERALGQGLRLTRVDGYPGLRNLRTDAQYARITAPYR